VTEDEDMLLKRAQAALEEAFDDNVKGLAMAKWAQVSGGQAIDAAMSGFDQHLIKIKTLRERQLEAAAKVFGAPS
jgi:hypothetical protein